jgi:hypothetical protein
MLPQVPSFPFDPMVLRAAFNSYFPFQLPNQPIPQPMPNLFPPIDTLASSQALTALAAKKRAAFDDHCVISDAKRHRYEDPLDLSSSNNVVHDGDATDDVDVDVLSIDPPSSSCRNDPQRWNVDQVAMFVANIESCQEYAEVSIFNFSS